MTAPGSKVVHLIRHAQTAWNEENRLQGDTDLPLSPLGLAQAGRLGELFASRQLQGIFSSPLQRSRQTADAIATGNVRRLAPVIERELAEIRLGAWEGLTPHEIDARYQGAYQRWRARPSSVCIPDGELLDQFRDRARRAFGRILAGLGDGEYVVVSHGGIIAAFLADLLAAEYGVLLTQLRLDNAGITTLGFAPMSDGHGGQARLWGAVDQPHIVTINVTHHLASLA
jgi:probable phosphoglycerate mutase